MKSILLRFPDKVVRYIRGEKVSQSKFDKIIDSSVYFGCTGWMVDNQENYKDMGWDKIVPYENITEVKIEKISCF